MNAKGRRIRAFRKKGKTYTEISEVLKLPKSTVAWWLKDFKLPAKTERKIIEKSRKKWRKAIIDYNNVHGKLRSQKAAAIREKYKQNGIKEIKNLSKKELKLIGSALYWAEGGKKNRNSLRFSNSNPSMIEVIMKFFQEVCNIPNEKIKARIHIYPQINPRIATNYWKKVTNLPRINFQKPQVQISRASKKKRPKNTLPYGTLHLTVNNTEMTCRVKGWIQGISEKI
jgi:hypothetical protein